MIYFQELDANGRQMKNKVNRYKIEITAVQKQSANLSGKIFEENLFFKSWNYAGLAFLLSRKKRGLFYVQLGNLPPNQRNLPENIYVLACIDTNIFNMKALMKYLQMF
eukprot:gene10461-2983_t